MDLSQDTWLRALLLRCTDASLPEQARLDAAARIAKDYQYHELVHPIAGMLVDPAMPAAAVSFALRVLYVGMRKWPQLAMALNAFRRTIAAKDVDLNLRTQAFMHLLLLDLDAAEKAAEAAMPEMLPLVRAERLYPTIRPETADAAYEEATLKLLFH